MSNKITDKQIQEALAKSDSPEEIVETLLASASGHITSGSKVTVVSDPSYPYEGIVGTVKSAPDGGYAKVEFPGGQEVNLAVNQLIPVRG